jgi:hypothetical protein
MANTLNGVASNKVGETVQGYTDDGATTVEVTKELGGTYTITAR